jgi:hypothetical protein
MQVFFWRGIMYSNKGIEIYGYEDLKIRNTIAQQESKRLAVVLPGAGYTTESPVLYYSRRTLWNAGWDLLCINYNYLENHEFLSATEDVQDRWFQADSRGVARAIDSLKDYEEVMLIGKSLGTTAMMNITKSSLDLPIKRLIWITPGTSASDIYNMLSKTNISSLVLVGSEDRHFKSAYRDQIADNKKIHVVEYAGADHSLENATNIEQSLDTLKAICSEIADFIGLDTDVTIKNI